MVYKSDRLLAHDVALCPASCNCMTPYAMRRYQHSVCHVQRAAILSFADDCQ